VRVLKDTIVAALIFVGLASVASAYPSIVMIQNGSALSVSPGSVNAVPDGGMTAILLGSALAVLAVLRRFVKR
jgi:hypothetical protein